MTVISKQEYKELKRFISFYSTNYMPVERIPPELRPVACLEMLEKKSFKMAIKGLRQLINDIIERSRHTDFKQLAKIDSELRAENIITLSKLRRGFSKDYARIIDRGKINNETEYYLVRNVVEDGTIEISETERDILFRMIANFEEKVIKSKRMPRR